VAPKKRVAECGSKLQRASLVPQFQKENRPGNPNLLRKYSKKLDRRRHPAGNLSRAMFWNLAPQKMLNDSKWHSVVESTGGTQCRINLICKDEQMTTKGPSKQSSVRIPDELRLKLEKLADDEGRTFSGQVVWMLRGLLAQRAFSKQSSQPHQAA
jgi:hypothetical protein